MTGTTSNGFNYELEMEARDVQDMDFLDLVVDTMSTEFIVQYKALKAIALRLIGQKQYDQMMAFLRKRNDGRVPIDQFQEMLVEMMNSVKELKNS